MTTPWAQRYALRTHNMSSSVIRELLKFTQQPDLISFAGGLPAPELFPIEQMKAACDVVLSELGRERCNTAPPKVMCHCARCWRGTWRAMASRSKSKISSSRPAHSRRWT